MIGAAAGAARSAGRRVCARPAPGRHPLQASGARPGCCRRPRRPPPDAPARPAPPPQTGQSHVAARAGQRVSAQRERSRAAHRPPVRGPVSEQPPAPAPRSAEGMMLAVARRFAIAYMPYQVGRLPRWARTAIERTCTPAFARYLLAQPARLTPLQAAHPKDDRDLPGRERRAGRGAGHGGGQLRLRAGQRRHRRVPAEAGQRARALAGRRAGGVSRGAPAVPDRAGADDPAAAAGGDAGVPRRGRRIGGAMRDRVCRRRAGRSAAFRRRTSRSSRARPRSSGSAPAGPRSWRRSTTSSRRSGSRTTRACTRARTTPARWARCSSCRAPGTRTRCRRPAERCRRTSTTRPTRCTAPRTT